VAAALTAADREQWIDAPHFEVVELHVRPDRQRQGIGRRLLHSLLERQPHDRAVLSAIRDDRRARGFYAKEGWQELTTLRFAADGVWYAILGKRLGAREEPLAPR